MKKRLPALALSLLCVGRVWALDANSQKLADRYLSILEGNPTQQTSLDRLWKIYHDAGETEDLNTLARQKAGLLPVLAAGLLQKSGLEAEAGAILVAAAAKGDASAAEILAGRLVAKGDAAGAAAILEQAVAVQPSPTLWIQLGVCWHKAGDPVKAQAAWEKAVALSPQDLDLRRKLVKAGTVAEDVEGALSHLAVIAEHGTPSERFEAWQEISRLREGLDQFSEAIHAQESLLALMGPGHWQQGEARRRRLELHRRAGTLDALGATLRKNAESGPRDSQAALRLAEYYEFTGAVAERLVWLRKAAELLPADTVLAGDLAALELNSGNPGAAAAIYDRLLVARPGDADVIFLRAEVAALSGDEAGAEKRAEAFLAAHPDDESAEGRVQEFYRRLRLSAPRERRLAARQAADPRDESAALELARFYLEENRDREAVAALARFDASVARPEETAATAFRFSQVLTQAQLEAGALAWAQKAAAADAGKPEYALHLAELLMAGGDREAARRVLEKACAAADGLPREDLDRRLHFLLQSPTGDLPAGRDGGEAMRGALEELGRLARRPNAGEADWLRFARWLRWSGSPAGAVAALREAVGGSEDSFVLREALAAALVETGDTGGAIQQLEILAARLPQGAPDYRRRIGQLEIDRGNAEMGLQIFSTLASEQPAGWQAQVDLATAEQAAGNWFKALETWQRVYDRAPAEARSGIRQPLLNAAARLQLHERALDFLERAVVSEKASAGREDLLREAAAYAAQNQVAPAWHDRLATHLAEVPGERSWEMGKVFLLEAEGRKAEARTALRDAQRDQVESAAVLEPLLKAAEQAEDWAEAARLARRLLALSPQPGAALSVQLARFLELAGRHAEAGSAWTAVASRHARDPVALTAAAEYFDRTGNGEKMEACYRGASRFGTCAPQVLLRLGGLALARGDRLQALEDFEAVLVRTRPDPAGAKNSLPAPDLLADLPLPPAVPVTPGGWRRPPGQPVPWTRPSETDNEGCRLLAIREAGRLLANSPRKAEWLAQFSSVIERIWALHASGETAAALDEIARLPVEPEEREAVGQAYAALVIDAGDGDRLVQWASGDPSRLEARWNMVNAAVLRLLDAGWRPPTGLFARAPAFVRWQISGLLASRNLYREAWALGEGVPHELPASSGAGTFPASAAWLELARWKIALRDPDAALECLDRAIAHTPASVSMGGPLFAAVRARWLLTPKDLRGDFEAKIRERLAGENRPGSREAVGALLAGLKGDPVAAASELAALFEVLGPAQVEEWGSFIQQGGTQLEDWNLAWLARELYRRELSRDRAFSAMLGQDFRPQTETLLITNQLATARPESLPYLLKEWLARGVGNDELLRVADRLKKSARPDRAAAVLAALSDRDPRDEGIKAGLLGFVDDPVTRPVAAAYVERLLAEPRPGPGQLLVQNAAMRLAAVWEQAGEYNRALALLARMGDGGLVRRALVQQRVRILCRLGRHREALAEVESQGRTLPPAGPGLSLSLASLYAGFGRSEEARGVLEKEASGTAPDRKAAIEKMRELFPGHAPSRREAVDLLADLDREGVPPGERFRAGRDFLIAHPELPEGARSGEIGRLHKLAGRDPVLLAEFFALRRDLAVRLGRTTQFEQELVAEWDGGRGNRAAGGSLLLWYLETKKFPELARLLDQALDDAHFNETVWDQAGQLLLAADQPELAARVLSSLIARAPGNANRALFLAEALWKSGRQTEARELVFPIERLAALDPARRVDLARYEMAIGNPDAARRHLLALADRSMETATATLWARLADQFLSAQKTDAARDAITRAVAVPSAVSGTLLADYHAAAGDLASRDPGSPAFPLPPHLLREFQIAAASRLVAADETARAWLWMEKTAHPLSDAAGRELLGKLEKSDAARAAVLWKAGIGPDATWEMRNEAARFFLRLGLAESSPAARLSALRQAHEFHPGSFAVADALARELLSAGKATPAKEVYQTVLESFSLPEDRLAAASRLEGM